MSERNRYVKSRVNHGMSKTGEWISWWGMIKRCNSVNDPSHSDYGGRGIKVCDRWLHSFENFLEDMGHRPSPVHSIGRLDNDKDYEPSNCRWEDPKQQSINKRTTKWIIYKGERKSMKEWCLALGQSYTAIRYRLTQGWGVDEALETPVSTKFISKAKLKL